MSSLWIEMLCTTFLVIFLALGSYSSAVENRSTWSAVTERSSPSEDLAVFVNRTVTSGPVPASSTTLSNVTGEFKKVCRGTNSGLGHMDDQNERYQIYKTLFTNCTHVDGNLEIVFLSNYSLDLSFLKNIREITGYVLIVANYLSYIPLTSLRIIRGRTLYEYNNKYFSLYVALNYDRTQPYTVGLKELRFNSLHEILAGNVFFYDNPVLCLHNTIVWEDILSGEGAKVFFNQSSDLKDLNIQVVCGPCHANCSGHCWGSGVDYCQELTRVSCSPQCDGHCFGPLPSQCCNPECAGGCTGPGTSQCWSCKNFDNGGVCENVCPPVEVYSPQEYKMIPNPNVKYAYGSLCVDKCPAHLIADKGACVQDCGAGKMAGKDGKCHECSGPCPKTCQIKLADSDYINSNNIKEYAGCTIIQGGIKILDSSFTGDRYLRTSSMRMSQLSVLESVQEVTDFVQIQANDPHFRNLTFLKNLKIIQGRKLDRGRASLQIFKTSLESLGLDSLEEIRFGHIYIANNSRLCYTNSIKWEKLRSKVEQRVIVEYNRNATFCAQDNEVCAAECTDDGCWGPHEFQCVSCRNFHLGRRCVKNCDSLPGIFTSGEKECQRCNDQCMSNCDGPGSDRCDRCKNATDGPYCVDKCPVTKYMDENNICQPCHPNCESGCTGPKNTVGLGGCNSCSVVVFHDDARSAMECLAKDSGCPDGYYQQKISNHDNANLNGKEGCRRCHPQCVTCNGRGPSFCLSCRNYKQGVECVSECGKDYFVNAGGNTCLHCDSQCLGCRGPTASDCVHCLVYKIYADFNSRKTDSMFNCTESCPDFAPHKLRDEVSQETICVTEDNEAIHQKSMIGIIISIILLALLSILITTWIMCRRRAEAKKSTQKLTIRMNDIDEAEPLKPTTAQPDMSQMRIVSESELKWGNNILGSGAFGTVFRGFWVPFNKQPIPVAIKVLQESTSGQSKEFLDEARIMSSVVHPCCVRILGICLSAQMMLITQLMPLGCLLEFIRKNKMSIGSTMLLKWCRQIAEGMNHLESHGIVHCDLAARNVLVESREQVKITDFGLAKMLEYGHNEFQVVGGKMPIKWLAIESITTRFFTHKSDVWSFGVTLWELFTFGRRPYENVPLREIPIMLEKGERLNQPTICSIDIYMLMIKCWMADPEVRPSFEELGKALSKMAEDPKLYLHIPYEDSKQYATSDGDDLEMPMENYIEPRRKGSGSVRYTVQPTLGVLSGPLQESSVLPVNQMRPKSSRLSSPVKSPDKAEEFQYEIMSPNLPKESEKPLMEKNVDVTKSRVPPQYINIPDGASNSGGNSDGDNCSIDVIGPEYISMHQPQSFTNPEYFDSLHDHKVPAAKVMLRHKEPTDNRLISRPRMDSVGFTESERSSTEDSSEHEYYNFYSAPPLGSLQLC